MTMSQQYIQDVLLDECMPFKNLLPGHGFGLGTRPAHPSRLSQFAYPLTWQLDAPPKLDWAIQLLPDVLHIWLV